MGFPKTYATTILSNVFKAGNTIALLSSINGDSYSEVSGTGYARYTIKAGDFITIDGVTTTNQHILFGLAEGDGWGTAVGFAVFGSGALMYLGELTNPKPIGPNNVPVFKKYAVVDGVTEGIKVTLDVKSEATATVNETT